jgi:hypothetical protein
VALLPALLFMDGGAASVRHGRRSWGAIGRDRERASVRQAIGAELDLGFAWVSRLWAGGCWARDCWAVAYLQNLTIFESSMNCTSPL